MRHGIRLTAEFVRDMVFSKQWFAGKNDRWPSVKPYQPKGFGKWPLQVGVYWPLTDRIIGESLYRRGMYTFIKLTVPPPGMMMFDASNRDQCEVKRLQTNTPLQALIMMNDPTVLEASRVLAQKLVEEKHALRRKN